MDELQEWDPANPAHAARRLAAAAGGLVRDHRAHEYWMDPTSVRVVLRDCAAAVERLGELGTRVTGEAEFTERTAALAELFTAHGQRPGEIGGPPGS